VIILFEQLVHAIRRLDLHPPFIVLILTQLLPMQLSRKIMMLCLCHPLCSLLPMPILKCSSVHVVSTGA
jgi:hypothetical protein